ncbi:Sua5/YciO/YrdC/YwlC family protein [Candidatus Gracilibacteria bacterium]|nr:Sua5/YciO/YrdC/YwlC family protein [Candidatus Gracilibacteria bacterium]
MLIIIPTDTCYGLAGELTGTDYAEIYRLKGRDFAKPLAILVRNYADMASYIDILSEQIEFLKKYPRPWSYLGKRSSQFKLPDFLDGDTYLRLSIRVAESCISADIRDQILYPLFLTSANFSGQNESKTLAEARESFPDIIGIDEGICDLPPSDIFYFDDSGEIEYMRKFS